MHWLWVAIIGLIAGAIAKAIMPGKDPGGCILTMVLGIAGSFVGAFLARLLGVGGESGTVGLIGSIIGAIIILIIYRLFVGRRGGDATP